MSKPKAKLGAINKKIESPLAKYNSAGQLTCIICNTVVKSELVWTAHINGKQHRDTVASLKKQKEEPKFSKPEIPAVPVKRKNEPLAEPPSKKAIPADFFDKKPVKSILKNAPKPPAPVRQLVVEESMEVEVQKGVLADFFDANEPSSSAQTKTSRELPEGFFDDPKLDAKVHNKEYKDPVEEEWDKFQKEIQDEITVSAKIQDKDQEESTVERQLEEIEEQIAKWGRVLELEKKREELKTRLAEMNQVSRMEESASDSSADEQEFEDFLDWRSKAT